MRGILPCVVAFLVIVGTLLGTFVAPAFVKHWTEMGERDEHAFIVSVSWFVADWKLFLLLGAVVLFVIGLHDLTRSKKNASELA